MSGLHHVKGLVQDCSNSIANTTELRYMGYKEWFHMWSATLFCQISSTILNDVV